MPSQNIYLVEDSPLLRTRLTELVESVPGARVVGSAARAADAVRGILALRPDIVLLDIGLAQGSGFDVLRAVHGAAPEIDVYLLSNFSARPYRCLAEQLGARGFLDKSTEFPRVRDLVAARAAIH